MCEASLQRIREGGGGSMVLEGIRDTGRNIYPVESASVAIRDRDRERRAHLAS